MAYSGISAAYGGSGAKDRTPGEVTCLWQAKVVGLYSLAPRKLLRVSELGSVGMRFLLQSLFWQWWGRELQKRETTFREISMGACNGPAGGLGGMNQGSSQDPERKGCLGTRDRYKMEWTSLARGASYGCAGCALHSSPHLRGTAI